MLRIDVDAISAETDTLLLMPAFVAVAIVAKIIPVSVVLWPVFGFRRGLAAGVLLSTNLSLILAAGAIALELELIEDAVNGALIVVALITTAVAPPVFSRLLGPVADEAFKRAILIGAGDTGGEIAPRLRAAGMEVTAIDTDENARSLAEVGCLTIVGDATTRRVLAQADLGGVEVAVIAVSDRERTVEVARGLREANNSLRIVTWVAEPDPRLEAMEVDTYW